MSRVNLKERDALFKKMFSLDNLLNCSPEALERSIIKFLETIENVQLGCECYASENPLLHSTKEETKVEQIKRLREINYGESNLTFCLHKLGYLTSMIKESKNEYYNIAISPFGMDAIDKGRLHNRDREALNSVYLKLTEKVTKLAEGKKLNISLQEEEPEEEEIPLVPKRKLTKLKEIIKSIKGKEG